MALRDKVVSRQLLRDIPLQLRVEAVPACSGQVCLCVCEPGEAKDSIYIGGACESYTLDDVRVDPHVVIKEVPKGQPGKSEIRIEIAARFAGPRSHKSRHATAV